MAASTPRVVVGLSDTRSGRAAVQEGIRIARDRGATLELVRVWRDVGRLFSMTLSEATLLSESQRHDKQVLEDARATVQAVAPDIPCTTVLLRGDLFGELLHRAEGAQLLLLGAGEPRSEGAAQIGTWFQRHAACPVRVVLPDAALPATR